MLDDFWKAIGLPSKTDQIAALAFVVALVALVVSVFAAKYTRRQAHVATREDVRKSQRDLENALKAVSTMTTSLDRAVEESRTLLQYYATPEPESLFRVSVRLPSGFEGEEVPDDPVDVFRRAPSPLHIQKLAKEAVARNYLYGVKVRRRERVLCSELDRTCDCVSDHLRTAYRTSDAAAVATRSPEIEAVIDRLQAQRPKWANMQERIHSELLRRQKRHAAILRY